MQLAAFTPFFRNHNIRGAIPQEPYRWDSVAHASRAAIAVRYALLPYWARPFFFATRDRSWLTPRCLVYALRKRFSVRHAPRTRTLF
jgi:Glycosyl hydrolases family 31